VSFVELRRQCERDGMGPLFWEALVATVGRISRRYPPDVYNYGEPWSEEAIRDLAQDVALERLIGENQLDYVLDLATDDDSLRRLLAFQVRRVLAHRRTRTVVDRLVDRVRVLVQSESFEVITLGSDAFIRLADSGRQPGFLADVDVRKGAETIDSIPRLPSSPSSVRESKVYTGAGLKELVGRLVAEFDGIALRDVRRILEVALTAWLPTILRESEENYPAGSTPELELERSQMTTLIGSLVRELDPVYRTVLLGKSQGASDSELAARVGKSRPWLADRKAEVLGILENRLMNQLPQELHSEATRTLLDELAILEDDS
jgi:hypothetical protein